MKTILHCDANNFYASVEALLNPALKDKPIIVCGNPEKRHGVVLSKSKEAKELGINTGETVYSALKKCPNLYLVSPHFDEYVIYSKKLQLIYKRFTNIVESFGIDECWLDVTLLNKKRNDANAIAKEILDTVKKETGLDISIGVSFNKIFSKLGSDLNKFNGITEISKDNFKSLTFSLPLKKLLFVGPHTVKTLNRYNLFSIGDLATADPNFLQEIIGINGLKLYEYANGISDDVINAGNESQRKSIGHGITLGEDISTIEGITPVISILSELISFRLRSLEFCASGVKIAIRLKDFSDFSKQRMLNNSFNSKETISSMATELLFNIHNFGEDLPIRAISISVFSLTNFNESPLQYSFLENAKKGKKILIEKKIFNIRKKYGFNSILPGVSFQNPIIESFYKITNDNFMPFA